MPTRCPHPTAEEVGSEPVAATAATLDIDLPGPSTPVIFQTLQWVTQPPLRWLLRLSERYGETFRLNVLGPRYRSDRSRLQLLPRNVVVLSAPAHLREVFARSRDQLLGGEANQFVEFHAGSDSVVVLDGSAHQCERSQLQTTLGSDCLSSYDELARLAFRRAFARWPDRGSVALAPRIREAVLEAGITSFFGPLAPAQLRHVRELLLAGAAATALPPSLLVVPWLRLDLGPWSPGGRLKRVLAEFDRFVLEQLGVQRARSRDCSRNPLVGNLLALEASAGSTPETAPRLLQRVRALLGATVNVSVAAPWLCYHVFRDPEVLARTEAAANCGAGNPGSLEGQAYLAAVCKELLRLNSPFIGGMRHVAVPTSFGGIQWQAGTVILPASALTHRRPELYPEPHRFRPERFLERSYGPSEFAPFGGGIRHCIGEQLSYRQMRLLLTELLLTFEVHPAGTWSGAERRWATMILPRDPLRANLRRRGTPAPFRFEA